MKKEPQIFTRIDKQNVPVSSDILDTLESEEIRESAVREYIREKVDRSTVKLLREYIRELLKEQEVIDTHAVIFPKGEWILLQPGDPRRESVKDELYAMIQQTYAPIGGHFKITDAGSLDRYAYWAVEDLDDDPQIDVALLGKPEHGTKMGAAGNDGSPAASAAYKEKSTELRAGGSVGGVGNWWGEVSGKPAYAMIKRGAPAIEDEATVRRIMAGDDFIWHGTHPDPNAPPVFKSVNGWYTKKFGDKASTKIILGSPA